MRAASAWSTTEGNASGSQLANLVQTNSEAYLHAMLKTSTDERLKRFVAGALATIGEVKQTMSQRPTPRARPAGLSFTIEG